MSGGGLVPGLNRRPDIVRARAYQLAVFAEFQEVRENPAIYYIAEFKYLNEEWRHFEVYFRPEGATQTYTFTLRHQMYTD